MEDKSKKNFIKGTLIAGALLSVSALSATPDASRLFDYNVLGSGAEVRSEILNNEISPNNNFEAKCGEKSDNKTEGKKTEAKCGEASCGEKKGEASKTEKKKSDSKNTTTNTTKSTTKSESKSTDAKCGEGKCGVD